MFIEKTEEIAHLLDNPKDRVFINNHVAYGSSANAHFLRYKHETKQWELEVRVEFAKFKTPLQEHQAKLLIDGNGSGNTFDLAVVNHDVISFDFDKGQE